MHYFALYGFMALIFQFAFISNVYAEPLVASVVFEKAKFDGIEWEAAWLKRKKIDSRVTEIKAVPKTKKKSQSKLSELDQKLKISRLIAESA